MANNFLYPPPFKEDTMHQDTCDNCGCDMLVYDEAMNEHTQLGFCNVCMDEPVTLSRITSDTTNHVIGMAI